MAQLIMLLLLLALCNVLVSAQVSYYIDCGNPSTENYLDSYGNKWQGDFVKDGETKNVQSGNADSDPIMDTLRVFTTGNKNCYAFDVEKGERILVRASFKYGNYDAKSSPPTFDLMFDGNFWTTVETSKDEVVMHEVTYVVKSDILSVCVGQTKTGEFPFLSALEVLSMDSDIYSRADSNYALLLNTRVAYGADAIIRSPTDYDRIWSPATLGNGIVKITDNSLNFAVQSPPIEVLQNAITTTNTSVNLILASGYFPSHGVTAYISMYFSEPTEVKEKRSFRFYVDKQDWSVSNIIPSYNDVEHQTATVDVSSNTTLSLVATTDSVLPPLINAIEIFYLSEEQLTNGTHADDVKALDLLLKTIGASPIYGDPCLPASFTWDWLECSNDATPRVTALHLDSSYLTGPLPDLSSMTGLKTIDMHNNSFTGVIPDYYGTLPNLKELNLADNQLSGSIPTSITKNKNIKLNVTGNSDMCTSGKCDDATTTATTTTTTTTNTDTPGFPTLTGSPSTGKKKKKTPLILGTTIPSGLLASAFVSFLAWVHHKRKKTSVASMHNAGSGGNFGEAVMDEIKVNIENQAVDEVSAGISQQYSNAT